MVRYRFSQFTLSPQRRLLVREGQEVALIPRYFDLLLLLIERRHEAVHRRQIFERVWGDVIVSESALSQAVRTIRRTLEDDPREPRFIRTVSRHGYQFVFPDVVEESDDLAAGGTRSDPAVETTPSQPMASAPTPVEHIASEDTGKRAAAEGLASGSMGGALAGVVAGGVGGLILSAAPGSTAPIVISPVLAVVAGVAGALGGAGVGAGVAFAEATATRSRRILAMTLWAALGGGVIGTAVQWLTRWGLAALIGLDLDIGGGPEGVVIGGFAGLGFTLATHRAAEAGSRLRVLLITALSCGLAGLAIAATGRPLAGGTIHMIADAAEGSRATLAPLGRLIGEPDLGPLSRAILAFAECASFGAGFALLFKRRPRQASDRPGGNSPRDL